MRDDAAIAIARAAYADPRWPECADATREVCLARYRDLMRDADRASEVARTWLTENMPALERDTLTLHHYPAWLHNAEGYLAARPTTKRDSVRCPTLFLHRRMALSGTCPSAEALQAAVDANDLAAGLGGRFEVLPSNQAYHPLEICAPSWMTPPSVTGPVRLPLLQLYCPTLRGVDLPSAPSTQPP